MTSDRRALAAALCVACLLCAGTARADPKGEARVLMERGSALYRRGDHAGALREFEKARAVYPSARIYFNIGQALSHLGRRGAAVDAFERFLLEARDAAPERRKDAEDLLRELRSQIGYVRVIAAGGSEITVDGELVGTAPLPRLVAVDPGSHQLTARVPGALSAHVGRVDVTIGETTLWAAEAAPPPLVDAPTPARRPSPLPARSGVLPAAAADPPSLFVAAPAEPPPSPARAARPWWPWAVGTLVLGGVVAVLLIPRGGAAPMGSLGTTDLRTR
jgi:hypothetical protein